MEVLIPLEMAKIIDIGIAQGNLSYIIQRGIILVVMAMLALFFGVQAGNMAAYAAAGYAKNLRHDIFYKVQDFSFKNIDHFSTSGLVTRMTTDITNDHQQTGINPVPHCHTIPGRHPAFYCKSSPPSFHQGI